MHLLSKFLNSKFENGRVKSDHVEYVKRKFNIYLKELYTHPSRFD